MKERFEQFTVLINKISRAIKRIKNQEMADYGLKSVHVSCLYYLYTSRGLTATELCERCEEDKATISRGLDYLEKNGFLTCPTKTQKRYKSPLILTPLGEEVGGRISDKIERVLCEVSVGLDDAERAEFYRCLAIISENLDSIARQSNQTNVE